MTEPSSHGRKRAWHPRAWTIIASALVIVGAVLPVRSWAQVLERTDQADLSEGPPSIAIDDAKVREGDNGIGTIVFRVRLSAPLQHTLTVVARTRDGSATATDLDYLPFDMPVTFPAGSTAESLSVSVRGDSTIEHDEWFAVALSVPEGITLADTLATATILNDDLPVLSIDDASMTEGEFGVRSLTFTARLSAPALEPVSLDLATADGSARAADADYLPMQRSLVFAPGSVEETFSVKVIGDIAVEPDQSFLVRWQHLVGATSADSEALGMLVNDDVPVLSVRDTLVDEGQEGVRLLVFRIQLSAAPLAPVSFHYQTVDGTAAVVDGDYLPAQGDTVLGIGESQAFVAVTLFGDQLLEGNERFTLRISDLQGATALRSDGIGTISNDERASFARVNVGVPMLRPGTLPPAFGDADDDGLPDLPLYQNTAGTLGEMPGIRAQLGDGNYHGAAWCDYDRDGDMDFVIMPYGGAESAYNRIHLFENRPEGFVDVAPAQGMDVQGFGETPVWGDFNADGWPDLFLPFYSHVAPFRSYFYLNLGGGQFQEYAEPAGIALENLPLVWRPEGVSVADWNGDGALDLYCANHLFLNDGDAHFTDVRPQTGLPALFDEGSQFVDYDNDGDLDICVRTSYGPTLYRNDGQHYADVTSTLGIGALGWEWGDRWADLDQDGDLDFLFFPPSSVARLLLNRGDGTFREDSSFAGVLSGYDLSSFGDLDGDGDLDIVTGAYGRQAARNLANQLPRTHSPNLRVRVEDDEGHCTQYGATVRLRSLDDPSHPVQTRIVDGGSGYLGQDEYTLHFGGVGKGAFDLEVSFPAKPGISRVVGPAQNPALAAIRPGETGVNLIIVRPNGEIVANGVTLGPEAAASASSSSGHPPAALAPAVKHGPRWAAAPNPAHALQPIVFTVPDGDRVSLTLHDLSGRAVRTWSADRADGSRSPWVWDLRDESGQAVPAGIYFARLTRAGHADDTRRLVVLP